MQKLVSATLALLLLFLLSACSPQKKATDEKTLETSTSTTTTAFSTRQTTSNHSAETSISSVAPTDTQEEPTPEYSTAQPEQTPAPEPTPDTGLTAEEKNSLIQMDKFDPTFVENLSRADYQIAVDRAQKRLEETGFGDVANIWYELWKMYPNSTTLFDNPPYDSYGE